MSSVNWLEILGWKPEQLDEIRYAGFSYLREGHYQHAQIYFEALVVLNPNNPYDLQTLGALYIQAGKSELALNTLNRALELNPAHEPTLLNKVKALLSGNQKAEALSIASSLERSQDAAIAGEASALIEAYS